MNSTGIAAPATAAALVLPCAERLRAFVRLGRPKFLVQSMMVVGLGVSMSVHDGHAFVPGLDACIADQALARHAHPSAPSCCR